MHNSNSLFKGRFSQIRKSARKAQAIRTDEKQVTSDKTTKHQLVKFHHLKAEDQSLKTEPPCFSADIPGKGEKPERVANPPDDFRLPPLTCLS